MNKNLADEFFNARDFHDFPGREPRGRTCTRCFMDGSSWFNMRIASDIPLFCPESEIVMSFGLLPDRKQYVRKLVVE